MTVIWPPLHLHHSCCGSSPIIFHLDTTVTFCSSSSSNAIKITMKLDSKLIVLFSVQTLQGFPLRLKVLTELCEWSYARSFPLAHRRHVLPPLFPRFPPFPFVIIPVLSPILALYMRLSCLEPLHPRFLTLRLPFQEDFPAHPMSCHGTAPLFPTLCSSGKYSCLFFTFSASKPDKIKCQDDGFIFVLWVYLCTVPRAELE